MYLCICSLLESSKEMQSKVPIWGETGMPIVKRQSYPTADAKKFPFLAECCVPYCNFVVSAATVEQAEKSLHVHETGKSCPTGSPAGAGKSLREREWDLLDEAVDATMKPDITDLQRERARGRAEGIATLIQLSLVPYWSTVNEVLQEAAKRYRIRQGKEEFSPTPGYHIPIPVGVSRSEGFDLTIGTVYRNTAPKSQKEANPLEDKIKALGERKIQAILRALDAGFERTQLAEIYQLSVAAVHMIASKPERFVSNGQ